MPKSILALTALLLFCSTQRVQANLITFDGSEPPEAAYGITWTSGGNAENNLWTLTTHGLPLLSLSWDLEALSIGQPYVFDAVIVDNGTLVTPDGINNAVRDDEMFITFGPGFSGMISGQWDIDVNTLNVSVLHSDALIGSLFTATFQGDLILQGTVPMEALPTSGAQNFGIHAVPEPSTLTLGAIALIAGILAHRRRKVTLTV